MDVPNFDILSPQAGQTSGLFMSLDPSYQAKQLANQQTQLQLNQEQVFKGGLPTDAQGNPDWGAAAQMSAQAGDFATADKFQTIGLQMGSIAAAQRNAALVGQYGGGTPASGGTQPASAATSPPTSRGVDPGVAAYIRTSALARGIDPNVALGVAASEGLRGFDPNGNANLGDGGSSAGPFQLHYGGVAGGGNSVPGLGDDFTKATGLDARDPSTWKQQVDFALNNAAQNGWSAFHGAAAAKIGPWAGIGVQPAQAGQAGQAGRAPAPVAAPAGGQAQPISFGSGAPATSSNPAGAGAPAAPYPGPNATITDAGYQAAKARLAQYADADPRTLGDVLNNRLTADTGIVDEYERRQAAAPPSPGTTNGVPASVSGEAPMTGRHVYAPGGGGLRSPPATASAAFPGTPPAIGGQPPQGGGAMPVGQGGGVQPVSFGGGAPAPQPGATPPQGAGGVAPTAPALPPNVATALARLKSNQGTPADAQVWGAYQRG